MKKIAILILAAAFLAGCFRGRDFESGPESTLETFYKGLCAGDFDAAAELCHSPEMDGYIDKYRSTFMKRDSTVRSIASDILSDMTVNVTDVEKNGHDRTIFYELTTTDGSSKEKVATLRKEEGAWKIEEITDRN